MKPKQSTALLYFYLFSYTFLARSLPNVSQSFKVSAHDAEQSLRCESPVCLFSDDAVRETLFSEVNLLWKHTVKAQL